MLARTMKDSIITDAVTLYAVLDPIATVPLFLSATRDESPASRRRIAARATVIAAVILISLRPPRPCRWMMRRASRRPVS